MQLKKKHRRLTLNNRRRCYYCGDVLTKRSASIDHMYPSSLGGSDERENKVLCCKPCNNEKANRTVEEYRAFLQHRSGKQVTFFGEQS